jgi:hypothetical protein
MKKNAVKRHKWVYPVAYTAPTEKKPATCACGAVLFYVFRKKRPGAPGRGFYGNTTQDEVIVMNGQRYVNASPRPGCTR